MRRLTRRDAAEILEQDAELMYGAERCETVWHLLPGGKVKRELRPAPRDPNGE